MVKITVNVKYPSIKLITPYRLSEPLTIQSKIDRILELNSIISEIQRWTNAERNYNT